MAEIKQTAPVKPVWPTRREQPPIKRNPPDPSGESDRNKRKQPQDPDGEQPGIDEYV